MTAPFERSVDSDGQDWHTARPTSTKTASVASSASGSTASGFSDANAEFETSTDDKIDTKSEAKTVSLTSKSGTLGGSTASALNHSNTSNSERSGAEEGGKKAAMGEIKDASPKPRRCDVCEMEGGK
jgi:hypothetical protein